MRNGVLILAFLALSAFVVSADAVDDTDSSLLAIEETLHDTPVRQSQRQFQQERLNAMRFAQTGTRQRGFFGKLLKGAGKLVKTVAKGALIGAISGGGPGALLGGVKAGLKLIKKGVAKNAGKLLASTADGIKAGAKIVGFVNSLPRTETTYVQKRVVRIPRVPGPDFSGPAPRPVRYYGMEAKPRMNRLSGAASEIPPGDVGCALCQFLVQRTQQDFAAFNAAAGGKGKGGKDGKDGEKAEEGEKKEEGGEGEGFLQIQELPALNDKNFVEAVLLEVENTVSAQVSEEEEEEVEEQSEEEEESEEQSEEEEEEESEEDVSLISTAAAATTGLSSEEQQELTEVLEETHDEAVADAVEKSVNGEQVGLFGAQVTEADLAGHPDFDESLLQITDEEKDELVEALQKSDAIVAQLREAGVVGADLTDAEKAELASMLEEDETAESQDSSYLTPKLVESAEASNDNAGVSFIETATKPRHYARMLHKAEEQTPVPDIVTTSFLSLGGITRDSWRQANGQRINLPSTPRRFRLGDVLSHRPVWNRFDPTVAPHPNAERQKARIMFQHMLQYTYDRLEGYCSTRLPEQFFPFCGPMLRNYRLIAEGIRYGDRPDQICMRGNFCPKGSYIRINSPHSVFAKLQ